MIVKSVQVADGKIHVTLTNKVGISFNSVQEVQEAAKAALDRVGLEGRIAIALVRASRPRDIEGTDLTQLIREASI